MSMTDIDEPGVLHTSAEVPSEYMIMTSERELNEKGHTSVLTGNKAPMADKCYYRQGDIEPPGGQHQ